MLALALLLSQPQALTMASSGSKLIINSGLRAVAHLNSSKLPTELAKSSAALLSSAPSGGKHELPDLPYDYSALERKNSCVFLHVGLIVY